MPLNSTCLQQTAFRVEEFVKTVLDYKPTEKATDLNI
jgi:hypothetical protein